MSTRLVTREGGQRVTDEDQDLAEWRQLVLASVTGAATWIAAMVLVVFLFFLAGRFGWL